MTGGKDINSYKGRTFQVRRKKEDGYESMMQERKKKKEQKKKRNLLRCRKVDRDDVWMSGCLDVLAIRFFLLLSFLSFTVYL